jgi:hypothetical protein
MPRHRFWLRHDDSRLPPLGAAGLRNFVLLLLACYLILIGTAWWLR